MRSTGDPITAALGGRLTADQLQERIHEAGYDRPIIVQYLEYLGQIFTRQLRHDASPTTGRSPRCSSRYGAATLELAFYALIVAFVVGIPLGHARRLPRATSGRTPCLRVFAILCYATPVFFAGLLLKLIFSVWLGWLPVARPRLDACRTADRTAVANEHRHLH